MCSLFFSEIFCKKNLARKIVAKKHFKITQKFLRNGSCKKREWLPVLYRLTVEIKTCCIDEFCRNCMECQVSGNEPALDTSLVDIKELLEFLLDRDTQKSMYSGTSQMI